MPVIFLKAAAVVAGYHALATLDTNNILNILTIALVVLAAFPIAKSRRKDSTIADLKEVVKSKTSLADERQTQIRNMEQATVHLKTEAAEWKARYEEQAHYTAEAAVSHFEELMEEHRTQVAERHAQLLSQGQATAKVLEGVAASLERIEGRSAA